MQLSIKVELRKMLELRDKSALDRLLDDHNLMEVAKSDGITYQHDRGQLR